MNSRRMGAAGRSNFLASAFYVAGTDMGERFFPYYQEDQDNWQGFAVVNYSDVEANLTFTAYGTDGNLLPLPNNPSSLTLAPKEQIARLGYQLFQSPLTSKISGWVRLKSDNPRISAFFQYGDNAGTMRDGANAFEYPKFSQAFPFVYQGRGAYNGFDAETIISVANPNLEPTPATLTLVTSDNKSTGISLNLPPNGLVRADVKDLFGLDYVDSGFVVLHVPTGGRVPGLVGFESIRAGANTLIGVNGSWTPPPSDAYSSYGSKNIQNVIKLLNPGGYVSIEYGLTIPFDISFMDGNGLITSAMQQVGTRTLTPGEFLEQEIGKMIDIPDQSTGTIFMDRGMGLVGASLFGYKGEDATVLPITGESLSELAFNHIANTDGMWTGVTIFVPGSKRSTIDMRAYSAEGSLLGSTRFDIEGYHRVTQLLTQYLPSTARINGGRIELSASNPVLAQELFGDDHLRTLSAVEPTDIQRPTSLHISRSTIVATYRSFSFTVKSIEDPFDRIFVLEYDPSQPNGTRVAWKSDRMPFTAWGGLLTGDIDNDAANEIVFLNDSYNQIYIFKEGSKGEYIQSQVSASNNFIRGLDVSPTIGDVDNDGLNELVMNFAKDIVYRWQDGKLVLRPVQPDLSANGGAIMHTSIGDADGDGKSELLLSCLQGGLRIFKYNGSTWTYTVAVSPGTKLATPPDFLTVDIAKVVDLDPAARNGNEIIGGGNYNCLTIWKATGQGYEILYQSDPLVGAVMAVDAADLDGDKDLEVIVGGAFNGLYVFKNVSGHWQRFTETAGPIIRGLPGGLRAYGNSVFGADIDNDGAAEIVGASTFSLYRLNTNTLELIGLDYLRGGNLSVLK